MNFKLGHYRTLSRVDPSALRVISMKLPFPGCLPLR